MQSRKVGGWVGGWGGHWSKHKEIRAEGKGYKKEIWKEWMSVHSWHLYLWRHKPALTCVTLTPSTNCSLWALSAYPHRQAKTGAPFTSKPHLTNHILLHTVLVMSIHIHCHSNCHIKTPTGNFTGRFVKCGVKVLIFILQDSVMSILEKAIMEREWAYEVIDVLQPYCCACGFPLDTRLIHKKTWCECIYSWEFIRQKGKFKHRQVIRHINNQWHHSLLSNMRSIGNLQKPF